MQDTIKDPLLWDWENARACILKEKKSFKHCCKQLTELYDKSNGNVIYDPYRIYSEIKKEQGQFAAEQARKCWDTRKKEVEWDEYRSLKLWEISGTVFGCTYLGEYECPIVSVQVVFPNKTLEEAIGDLRDRWEVKIPTRHEDCDFLHMDSFHPMFDIVRHRLGIRNIGDSLYSENDIEELSYEVKNATSQYYLWWCRGSVDSSFRNSLGLSPTVDIEKALAMRISRLYNETVKNLHDINLNRIKFAEIMQKGFQSDPINIIQGELFSNDFKE